MPPRLVAPYVIDDVLRHAKLICYFKALPFAHRPVIERGFDSPSLSIGNDVHSMTFTEGMVCTESKPMLLVVGVVTPFKVLNPIVPLVTVNVIDLRKAERIWMKGHRNQSMNWCRRRLAYMPRLYPLVPFRVSCLRKFMRLPGHAIVEREHATIFSGAVKTLEAGDWLDAEMRAHGFPLPENGVSKFASPPLACTPLY